MNWRKDNTPTMQFDATVSLSTLIAALAVVITVSTAYVKGTRWLSAQLTLFQVTLNYHAEQIKQHSLRMDRYEAHYVTQATHLQRIVGRLEGQDRRMFVRSPPLVDE